VDDFSEGRAYSCASRSGAEECGFPISQNFEISVTKLHVLGNSEGLFKVRRGKGKGLDTCYSVAYMSQTRDQQRFTISELAADWHEPVVPQHIMWPSIASDNGQLDPRCS